MFKDLFDGGYNGATTFSLTTSSNMTIKCVALSKITLSTTTLYEGNYADCPICCVSKSSPLC
jgi:hypothetical protein